MELRAALRTMLTSVSLVGCFQRPSELPEPGDEMAAPLSHLLQEALVTDDVERRLSRCGHQRTACERRAVITGCRHSDTRRQQTERIRGCNEEQPELCSVLASVLPPADASSLVLLSR
jgi:hypothetical protein